MISPRQFTSGMHQRNAALWGPIPLQPFANARLLLGENAISGVGAGDLIFQGLTCRATRLPPHPGAIWLSRELQWSQNSRRISTAGRTVVAPCEGAIWLGNLTLLNAAGDVGVDPYAQ